MSACFKLESVSSKYSCFIASLFGLILVFSSLTSDSMLSVALKCVCFGDERVDGKSGGFRIRESINKSFGGFKGADNEVT